MVDEEQLDEFLGALEALDGSSGNGKLCELLDWDEATYDAVKTDLIEKSLNCSDARDRPACAVHGHHSS